MRNPFKISCGIMHQTLVPIIVSVYLIVNTSMNLLAFDEKRICELILIGLILLISLLNEKRAKNLPLFNLATRHQNTLSAIAILLVFSSLFAEDQLSAFLQTSLYLGLFLFSMYIGKIAQEIPQTIPLFFAVLILSALFYQINFFTAFLASFIANIPLQWPEPFSGFSNVRFFNQFQIWTIAFLPLPLLLYPTLDKRLLTVMILIAVGWALLLFASGSRGAISSIVISMLLTSLIFRKHSNPLLKLNSLILLAGAAGYLILFKLLPFAFDNNISIGWEPVNNMAQHSDRLNLWHFAVLYIVEHPWLGIGPMHYAYYTGPAHAHPHNSFLQWTCEMGIPSALLVIYLTYSALSGWIKKFYYLQNENKLYAPTHLWIAMFYSVCSGLIFSLVSGVIVMPLSQIMMALVFGWMIGLYFHDRKSQPVSQTQQMTLMLLTGATLITMAYTVLPSLMPRLISYADLPYQDYPIIAPRFWQIGGIPH